MIFTDFMLFIRSILSFRVFGLLPLKTSIFLGFSPIWAVSKLGAAAALFSLFQPFKPLAYFHFACIVHEEVSEGLHP